MAAACLTLGGCNYGAPYVDSFTEGTPAKADLVGTYVLTDETLIHDHALIDGDPYKRGTVLTAQNGSKAAVHKLILRSDGTFSAVNIPLWTDNQTQVWTIKNFQSGSGQWFVEEGGISFSTPNLKLIPNDNNTTIRLLGQKPPYTILFYYARDPDFDDAMSFEKEN